MKKALSALFAAAFLLAGALPALAADTTRPTVGTPGPEQATAGAASTVSAAVSDTESGIASCNLYVDNEDVGSMIVAGGTASISYAFMQAGIHTMFVFCRDNENNFNSGANASVTVSPASSGSGDVSPPSVGPTSPSVAFVAVPVTISAAVSDTGTGIGHCQLIVNGFGAGTMTVSAGTASRSHTFDATGTHSVFAQCSDLAGNNGTGSATAMTVSSTPPPAPNLQPALIKLACPAGSGADHHCRAVYYRGADGKRHAFPNANIYFTWYPDFSTVKTISAGEMATYPLAKNVTYRPGSRLVKFSTLNNVYAVARGGTLRWVKTEAAAATLYSATWNKGVHDLSDAFYPDYKFGADINIAADFSPSAEMSGTATIDQNF